ncbi:hypothetical protein CK203_053131 [Vitis vinifera]|uniref:Molybdenum cofactor sulfurase n=1 Tax=Vitis vinifera TaxID=29760 RepID=A0A438GL59_VITVI|nr:hypothetical protein CK203_053131 [Vitis vinifera]
MHSLCSGDATQVCLHGCCPRPVPLPEPQKKVPSSRSTAADCRRDFAATTAACFFPNTQFTNHESLPSLQESFTLFEEAYPQYSETDQLTESEPRSTIIFFSPTTSALTILASESALESAMKRKIMGFLNISENDYCMVFTANRTSAFKLLAESYPFQSSQKLLTVYDYESEAVEAMVETSEKRGARVMSAEFSWPRLRVNSGKLRKMVVRNKKKKNRGLFVFPLQSRMTGARYHYLWMNIAQENGWHVFGENPTGFGCLFVKKSTVPILEASTSTGIVNLVPAKKLFWLPADSSGTDTEPEQTSKFEFQEELHTSSSFSGPLSIQKTLSGRFEYEQGETSELPKTEGTAKHDRPETSKVIEMEKPADFVQQNTKVRGKEGLEIECRGLDHVDSLGLVLISRRARYLINWLVNALTKLHHPNTEEGSPLVRIYGPNIKFERGPALAFNVFDWKGEKVEPILLQKLADRSNISLSYGFLHHLWFSDKYEAEKQRVIERRETEAKGMAQNKRKGKDDLGITVVTAALGFLTNFEDIYRLWAFVAQFLDADFVEKERWRYTALNQKTIEV